MFRDAFQHGLLTIFSSLGSSPLLIWDVHIENGHIRKLTDPEINSTVFEIAGVNVSTCYMTCPKKNQTLGIHLPFLVMIIKNLHKYFSFEVTILDETYCRRRFRVSNFNSSTHINPFCTSMPIGLSGGWNQIQFNLAEFTRRAYKLQYSESVRVQINANARVRRIYFTDKLYTEDELPPEYKLFFPLKTNTNRRLPKEKTSEESAAAGKENEQPASKDSLRTQATKSNGDLVKSQESTLRKVLSNIQPKISTQKSEPIENVVGSAEFDGKERTRPDYGVLKAEEIEREIGEAEQGDVLSTVSMHKTSASSSYVDKNISRNSMVQETAELVSREGATDKSDEETTGESEPDAFVGENEIEANTDEYEHEAIVEEQQPDVVHENTLTVIKEETESAFKMDNTRTGDTSSE